MVVSGAQIRAGRALLGWSRDKLARMADVHGNAVAYWERKGAAAVASSGKSYAVHHISRALRDAGVEFVHEPAPGVRFATIAGAVAQPLN